MNLIVCPVLPLSTYTASTIESYVLFVLTFLAGETSLPSASIDIKNSYHDVTTFFCNYNRTRFA